MWDINYDHPSLDVDSAFNYNEKSLVLLHKDVHKW